MVKNTPAPLKGQRPISSFFSSTPKPAKAEGSKANDPSSSPPEAAAAEPSRKRARAEPEAPAVTVTAPAPKKRSQYFGGGEGGGSPERRQEQEAFVDLGSEDELVGKEAERVEEPAKGKAVRVGGAGSSGDAAALNHQRFQNKLVLGVGANGRRGKTKDDIVPQKKTPLEQQVAELKERNPGVLLIVEVGYKMKFFGDDAEAASRVCNIFCFPDRNYMVASIPVPRLSTYVRRLVEAGYKVGVVRQVETAALKKQGDNRSAPFTRKLTGLYTRATLEAGDLEESGEARLEGEAGEGVEEPGVSKGLSRYLLCVVEGEAAHARVGEAQVGLVAIETSTGDVLYAEYKDNASRGETEARLLFANPAELLVAEPVSTATARLLGSFCSASEGARSERVEASKYSSAGALASVMGFYAGGGGDESGALEAVQALPGLVLQALAHALDYLRPFGLEGVLRLGASFRPFSSLQEPHLSANALTQLEVLQNSDGGERGSLLWLLQHTRTAPGSRLLRSWVTHPLRSRTTILERLDAVSELLEQIGGVSGGPLASLTELLGKLSLDLERGTTRSLHRTSSPSETAAVLRALATLGPSLGGTGSGGDVEGVNSVLLQRLLQAAASPEVTAAAQHLLALIHPDAAAENNKLGLFASEERFPEVFEALRVVEREEAALQGHLPVFRSLLRVPRLEYVSVTNQGDFLIEVPAERKDVPKAWKKVSGTKKVNRFQPPEVIRSLSLLEVAREELQLAANAAWLSYLSEFGTHYGDFRAAVSALSQLDALQSLASVALSPGYVKPTFAEDEELMVIEIKAGRHPVLDALQPGAVVPNDVHLAQAGPSAVVVTGPNMGGKSCYIRQVALTVIMAQIGSYVPAESAHLHVVDGIFTRMGAQDSLAMGRSTFLEELSEASEILAKSTPQSLVILDELGRGTATHDGLAIATATLSFLARRRTTCLFVTHHPKVSELRAEFPGLVTCRTMAYLQEGQAPSGTAQQVVGKRAERITFLYKLKEGVADRSFGLNVARMAQLPEEVIVTAGEKAEEMEEGQQAASKARRHRSQAGGQAALGEKERQFVAEAVKFSSRVRSGEQGCLVELRKLQGAIRKAGVVVS